MASRKSPDIPFAGEPDTGLDETQRKKSVLITNVPPGTKEEDLIIYFQKESNGGGEVEDAKMLEDGKALVIFDEEEVANRVLKRKQTLDGTLLQLEPCFKFTDDVEVFSLVSAKLDTSRFTIDLKELNELLVKAHEETGVNFLETCEGYLVSGTLEQIEKSCLFFSRYAKRATPVTENSDNLQNVHRNDHPLSDSDDEENALKTLVLDVEPKLMQILQIKVNEIEKKFKMKINWKSEPGKAHLSPNGKDVQLFEDGKEEFITLYQKEFQDLQEKDFPIDAGKNIEDINSTAKELMKQFSVIIERKDDKNVHIFGKENDVAQVMQQLQGKFGKRRGRKLYKASSNGELPMPDTYAQAAMLPLSKTLDNGVVVSVHQGDITKAQVDVIVNAANERLDHGGGVAGAIVKQGGRQIQQESDELVRRYGRFPVGKVAHTGPGNLPYKRIFHAVGPQWTVHGEKGSRQLIFEACMNCFNLASKNRTDSIALPGISSGIYGVPKTICAEIMFAAAESFAAEASSDNQLKDIRFVNIDTPTYEAFRREFYNRYGSRKEEAVDLRSNLNNENAVYNSYEMKKESEFQRNTNQPRLGLTRTGQKNTIEESESQKRANAADRRMEQERKNQTAKDGEKPREQEVLSKKASHENISPFVKAFKDKEKGSSKGIKQSTKANGDTVKHSRKSEKGKEANPPVEDKKENELSDLPANMGINEDTLRNSRMTETNDHRNNESDPEIADTKDKEKVTDKSKSMDINTENRDSGAKEDYSAIPKERGKGRGALSHTQPRQLAAKFSFPPGLNASLEGLNFAKLASQESEVKEFNQDESGLTARRKHPESELKDTTDGVPSKKVKFDGGIREKNGEGSTKQESDISKKIENRPGSTSHNSGKDDKKEEVKEVNQTESDVDKHVDKSETVSDERKKESEAEEKEEDNAASAEATEANKLMDFKVRPGGVGQSSHQDAKDESSVASAEAFEPEKLIDSQVHGCGDDQSSQDAKDESSTFPVKVTEPEKPMDSKVELVGEGQSCNRNRKDESSTFPVKVTEPEKPMDSKVKLVGDGQSSHQDKKDESSTFPVKAAEPAEKPMDSKVELFGDDQSSHEDKKDESSAASAGKNEANEPKDSKVKRVGDVQSTHEDKKDESSAASAEKNEANEPNDSKVKRIGFDQSSHEDKKDESSAASAGKNNANEPKDSKVKRVGDDQSSHEDKKDESRASSAEKNEANEPKDSKVKRVGDDQSSHEDKKDESRASSAEKNEANEPKDSNVERGHQSQSPYQDFKEKSKALSAEATDPKNPLDSIVKLDDDGQSSDEERKEEGKSESAEATDHNVSNGSVESASLNSFVLLDMSSVDHDNSSRSERKSISSDGSSESIELLNHPERDGFSDTSSTCPANEQGDDLAQPSGADINNSSIEGTTLDEVNPVSDSHRKAKGKTVGSLVADNKHQNVENDATQLEGGAGSSSMHQEADNTESIIKDNDHSTKISSVEDLSHDTVKKADNSDKETTSATSNENPECGFCFSTLDAAQLLRICDSGHAVCRNCFDNLQNAEHNSVCPTCHEAVPRISSQPPNGQMKSGIIEKGLLGYESYATIYVDYEFPEGTQGPFHPNPGTPYDKLSRRTFLPDNEEGREVLDLLKKAFDARILFTVGKSTINDKDNQIIFNGDMDHKTNVNGGPKVSGYPDPDYLDRVKKQLNAKGIE